MLGDEGKVDLGGVDGAAPEVEGSLGGDFVDEESLFGDQVEEGIGGIDNKLDEWREADGELLACDEQLVGSLYVDHSVGQV